VGLFCLFVIYLPVLILNSDMYTMIHDQFDGEVLAYILNAKYFMQGHIPEFLSGTDKISLLPPSFGTTFFYCFLEPDNAFFVNYIFVVFVAYTGMYLLIEKLLSIKWIAAVVGCLFAMLPFYSVYGLSVMGQPLFFYAVFLLWNNENLTRAYILVLIFTLFSSLVLVGYVNSFFIVGITLYSYCAGRRWYGLFIGTFLTIFLYVILNYNLILQVLHFTNSFISHKQEFLVNYVPFYKAFDSIFWNGMYHAASCHEMILKCSFVGLILAIIKYKDFDLKSRRSLLQIGSLIGIALIIALFYAFWHCYTVTNLRNELGGLFVAFQVDRFYWLYPCIWFCILAYTLFLLSNMFMNKMIRVTLLSLVVLINFQFLWQYSSLKVNLKAVIDSSYVSASYTSVNRFFQRELFKEIEEHIGLSQTDYKVCSVGLYPSIALYNGYYCIDGYSNNYDIEYKHYFREIISKELEKAGDKAKYFDNWGNRCYIFSSEIFNWNYIDKRSKKAIKKLELNNKTLKEMNCKYLFSSVEIIDSYGLVFEKKFSSNSSWYDVYVYKIF